MAKGGYPGSGTKRNQQAFCMLQSGGDVGRERERDGQKERKKYVTKTQKNFNITVKVKSIVYNNYCKTMNQNLFVTFMPKLSAYFSKTSKKSPYLVNKNYVLWQ